MFYSVGESFDARRRLDHFLVYSAGTSEEEEEKEDGEDGDGSGRERDGVGPEGDEGGGRESGGNGQPASDLPATRNRSLS